MFADLKNAFDTADHKILIKKLSHYENNTSVIVVTKLKWFCSYPNNR